MIDQILGWLYFSALYVLASSKVKPRTREKVTYILIAKTSNERVD